MELLKRILENKDNLKEERWFHPTELLSEFEIYDFLEIDNRLTKKYYESWICTDTQVGIAVYFLDGEVVCISWQPYRKSTEEFWFVSEELGQKLHDYFLSLLKIEQRRFRLIN